MKLVESAVTDSELIGLLRDRKTEEKGILFLYKSQRKALTWYVTQNNGSEDDAQDIFQEVVVCFIHMVQQDKFRGESSIKTFLYSLNRNIWLNELKRRGKAVEREKTFEQLKEQKEASIEKALEQREASRELLRIMEELGENCKKILLLYYYENCSMKDILSELNYENEQVIRNKKYKCLKKLEEMIQQDAGLFIQLKNLLHG
ncbi:MAG: sigma-70 family RNA polymerase sigma factor [Bacteroidota bacterium]